MHIIIIFDGSHQFIIYIIYYFDIKTRFRVSVRLGVGVNTVRVFINIFVYLIDLVCILSCLVGLQTIFYWVSPEMFILMWIVYDNHNILSELIFIYFSEIHSITPHHFRQNLIKKVIMGSSVVKQMIHTIHKRSYN